MFRRTPFHAFWLYLARSNPSSGSTLSAKVKLFSPLPRDWATSTITIIANSRSMRNCSLSKSRGYCSQERCDLFSAWTNKQRQLTGRETINSRVGPKLFTLGASHLLFHISQTSAFYIYRFGGQEPTQYVAAGLIANACFMSLRRSTNSNRFILNGNFFQLSFRDAPEETTSNRVWRFKNVLRATTMYHRRKLLSIERWEWKRKNGMPTSSAWRYFGSRALLHCLLARNIIGVYIALLPGKELRKYARMVLTKKPNSPSELIIPD